MATLSIKDRTTLTIKKNNGSLWPALNTIKSIEQNLTAKVEEILKTHNEKKVFRDTDKNLLNRKTLTKLLEEIKNTDKELKAELKMSIKFPSEYKKKFDMIINNVQQHLNATQQVGAENFSKACEEFFTPKEQGAKVVLTMQC